jgi:hypothetical protein
MMEPDESRRTFVVTASMAATATSGSAAAGSTTATTSSEGPLMDEAGGVVFVSLLQPTTSNRPRATKKERANMEYQNVNRRKKQKVSEW